VAVPSSAGEEKFPHKSAILRPLSVQGPTHRLLLDTRYRGAAFMSDEIYRAEKIAGEAAHRSFRKFVVQVTVFQYASFLPDKIVKLEMFEKFKSNTFLIVIIIEDKCRESKYFQSNNF